MEGTKSEEVLTECGATEPDAKKKRNAEGEAEPGTLRLKLSGTLGTRVRETVLELKNRGVNATAEEIMADFLERLPDRYFEGQLLKRTPERFYIETAIELPEVREKLIRQAKKSLEKFSANQMSQRASVSDRKNEEAAQDLTSSAG